MISAVGQWWFRPVTLLERRRPQRATKLFIEQRQKGVKRTTRRLWATNGKEGDQLSLLVWTNYITGLVAWFRRLCCDSVYCFLDFFPLLYLLLSDGGFPVKTPPPRPPSSSFISSAFVEAKKNKASPDIRCFRSTHPIRGNSTQKN